jgi:hypothetical protein
MRIKPENILIVLILLCLHSAAGAQQVLNIKGILFKKSSADRISQALITDMKSQVVMMSDELGGFTIKASAGDTLLITKNSYTPQKIVVTNANDIVLYMQPVIQLGEVTIKGQTTRQELNGVVNTYRAKGLYFDGKPPIWAFINPFGGSPITAFYELFSKDAANERRFIKFSKNEMEAVEVDRRYTKDLVMSITKMPDDEAQKFMITFRPSYEDMKEWNDYQLIEYIKKNYAYYQMNKDKLSQKLY